MALTVADVFCGAGGFSEGFRQARFEVVWAIDNWHPAVETFRKNHPTTNVISTDVMDVSIDDLEPVDVLIGSPPCTHFSLANRGGRGDHTEGMKLILRFFEFVEALKPKYWIMENVPNLKRSLSTAIDGTRLKYDGKCIEINRIEVLNTADFGVPQKRLRLFWGEFPLPEKIPSYSMGDVITSIPDPLMESDGYPGRYVKDPLYELEIPVEKLTDHFIDTTLTDEQAMLCKKRKTNHPVFGKMNFPDDFDRPARTITSTMITSSRHTIVIGNQSEGYRTLTPREAACIQGFPLSYQFWASSIGQKAKMIGNAVPPPLARAIAHAILEEEKEKVPSRLFLKRDFEIPPAVTLKRTKSPTYSLRRTFKDFIPGSKSSRCRVDLDNRGVSPSEHHLYDARHLVQWITKLYLGYAKDYKGYVISFEDSLEIFRRFIYSSDEPESYAKILRELVEETLERLDGKIPDSSTLQAIWSKKCEGRVGPNELVKKIGKVLREYSPVEEWKAKKIPRELYEDFLEPCEWGEKGTKAEAPPDEITLMAAAALVVTSMICDLINENPRWMMNNRDHLFRHAEWTEKKQKPGRIPDIRKRTLNQVKTISQRQ